MKIYNVLTDTKTILLTNRNLIHNFFILHEILSSIEIARESAIFWNESLLCSKQKYIRFSEITFFRKCYHCMSRKEVKLDKEINSAISAESLECIIACGTTMKEFTLSVTDFKCDTGSMKTEHVLPQTQQKRKLYPQFIAAFLANLGPIAFGVANGWTSPTVLLLRNPETGVGGRGMTLEEESWIGSLAFLAAFLMAPVYSQINQKWGRKAGGYLTALPFILAWLFIIFADSIIYVFIARFFMGAGMSGVNIFATLYCGEIAEDKVRGALGTLRALFAVFGLILSYAAGPYLSIHSMGIVALVVPLIFLVGLLFLPESPMFLMVKGKDEQAMKSLMWLCGGRKEAAEEEMEKLSAVVREFTSNTSKRLSLKDLVSFPGTRRAMIIAFIFAIIQQFSGMYVIFSFCAPIFEMAGTDMSSYTSTLIVTFVLLLGSLLVSFITDIAGRRIILILTQLLAFLTLGALGAYFYLKENDFDVSVLGVLPVICLSLNYFAMALGMPCLLYVFLAFIITKFYPILVPIINSYGCFWIFAGVALFGAVYIYFELPETKNRSLESILRELNGETKVKGSSKSGDEQMKLSTLLQSSSSSSSSSSSVRPTGLRLRVTSSKEENNVQRKCKEHQHVRCSLFYVLCIILQLFKIKFLFMKMRVRVTAMKEVSVSVIEVKNEPEPNNAPLAGTQRRKKLPQFLAAILANLGPIAFGVANGWTSPTVLLLRNPETGVGGRGMTLEEESWIGSLAFLAAFLMAPVYSQINQKWGRKAGGYLTALPFILAWLFIIFADSIIYVFIARFFMGAGMSGVNIFATLYCGKDEQAMKSLMWLCGGRKEAAEEEMEKLSAVVREFTSNTSKRLSLKDLVSFPGTRRAMIIAFIFAIIQQFSGMYVIFSFCAPIFEMAGTDMSSYTSTLIVTFVLLLGSLLVSFITDIAGRRIILILTQLLAFLTLGALGAYFYLKENDFDVTNLVSIAFGSVNGWPSPTLLLLRDPETGLEGRPITLDEESWVSSVLFLAALVAVPLYSHVNQEWGRKATGYLTAIPFIVGWCFIIFSDAIVYLLVGRCFMGFGGSGVNVFVTMYCGEIAEDNVRGALGTFRSMFANFGILYMYGAGPYLSVHNMAIVSVVIPLLFMIGLFWLPESPMFLSAKGRDKEAMESMLWLCGGNKEAAELEMEKIAVVVRDFTSKSTKRLSIKDLLAFSGTRRALLITFILAIIQQFSGMYVVLSFCASIFEMAGTDLSPHTSSLIVALFLLIGSLVASFVTDLAGRRIVLIVTQIVLFITLAGLGTYFYLKETGFDVSVLGILPVVCLSIYCVAMVCGMPTLAYVVVSEIFNPEARGIAVMTLNSVVWLLAFLIMKFYPILLTVIYSYGCFWLFSVMGLFGAFYVYFQLPETKNRSIESILRELNGEIVQNQPNS
ncbi:hypothetical protein C0J52_01619 [Blattella germanica]|nr:hypothetical protein C0J52_01619 [Blattella germanica]